MIEFDTLKTLRDSGLSGSDIARELNVTPSTICRHLRKHGLARTVERPSPENLLHDLTTTGRKATAEKYGVSATLVARWLKAYQGEGLLPKKIFYTYRQSSTVTSDYKKAEKFNKPMPPAADIVEYLMDHTFLQAAEHFNVSVVTFWRWTRYYRARGEMA